MQAVQLAVQHPIKNLSKRQFALFAQLHSQFNLGTVTNLGNFSSTNQASPSQNKHRSEYTDTTFKEIFLNKLISLYSSIRHDLTILSKATFYDFRNLKNNRIQFGYTGLKEDLFINH